jgi:thiol-disulfide isomerase/thioredoxin
MKLVIWIFLFNLLCPKLFSQTSINFRNDCKPFSLNIKVNNQDTGKIRLMFGSCGDSNPVTVVNLKNGMAKFNGFINQASDAVIITDASSERYRVDGPKVIKLILEPKPMNLSYSLNDSSAYDIVISGSNSQIGLDTWLKQNSSELTLKDNIGEKFNPNLTVAERKLINNELDSVYSIIIDKIKNFVIQNKNSYASTYLLKQYYIKIPIDTLKSYYSMLTERARQNALGEVLLENILTLSSKEDAFIAKYGSKNFHTQLKFAKSFLDFTLSDADDKTYKLNNFKEQYTFVNVWATWCAPCVKNIPAYEKLKTQYKDQPINFVSISVDKDANKWKKALQQYKLTGTNLLDIDNILPSFYEIQGFPRYLIIGPDGKVVESNAPWSGSTQLNKLIDKYTLKKTGN